MTASSEDMERLQQRRGSSKRIWVVVAAIVVVVLLVGVAVLAGWFNPPGTQTVTILGAGATFPCPLITKWSRDYANRSLSYDGKPTQVQVNYNCVGSGSGIRQITQKTVDFAGTDAPLNATVRATNPGLLHIPETLGAVVATYNLAGIPDGLNLTGHTLAEIFLGRITTWNHLNITRDNSGVNLPASQINVVHRSDGSGTTFVWTSFLNKSNPEWTRSVVGTSINWPVGAGASGNSGVAGAVRTTPNSIGYVELAYAIQNQMPVAKIRNPSGNWIYPSLAATAAAAASFTNPPNPDGDWFNVSLLNTAGATAYPVASLTYILVYRELNVLGSTMTLAKARALVDFLWWAIHEGQDSSEALTYPKLAASLVTLDEGAIRSVTFNGQTLHS